MIWSSLQDRSVSWLEDVRGRTFALRLPVLRPGPQSREEIEVMVY